MFELNKLYNMDCLEAMKEIPDKYFELAIVDPPYGIGIGHKVNKTVTIVGGGARAFGGNSKRQGRQHKMCSKFYHPFDDSSTPDGEYFKELKRVSKNQIIWGGNFFLDNLGATSCIIVWDKGRRNMDQADCEIAWTSLKGQSRIFEFKWNGMLQGDMKNKEQRFHPTQKPVALYTWVINRFAKEGDKILDTHAGSGSCLIAAYDTGHDWLGFELDKFYYEKACERIERHTDQMRLW